MKNLLKIGLGGGCHWCTEGVFASLKGVNQVEQGWISATDLTEKFSEAVIVHFDPDIIPLSDILEIHLLTHSSSSVHRLREKYRSAIYVFSDVQFVESEKFLSRFREMNDVKLITEVLHFNAFKPNTPDFTNYFFKQPDAMFCKRYIHPKLGFLQEKYGQHLNLKKLEGIDFNSK